MDSEMLFLDSDIDDFESRITEIFQIDVQITKALLLDITSKKLL